MPCGGRKTSPYNNTVDSRYLEVQGTRWNSLKYPYLDVSE